VTSTASQPKTSKPPMPAEKEKEVAIIGAGIAGLTCALRLSKRGYKVTLYEKDGMLGGDLSSKHHNGMYHDVYTHLFCDWYVNFWRIVEDDLKIKRDDAFEPRLSVKLLDPSSSPRHSSDNTPSYTELKNPNTLKNVLDNLLSRALPPPDMFLVGFTLLDLASQPFHRSNLLEQQTVNGFLYSRPYVTPDCADLHNTILNEIWCISSSDTSAAAYKDFVKHVLGSCGLPFAWLLRGSLEEMLIKPWQESLKNDCDIRASVEVTAIEVGDDDKMQLTLSDNTKATHANVVFAVPAPELAKLVMTGSPGRCVVERLPALSELQRLRTASILVVTVFFKEKLPNIPREHVGLAGSRGYLTFIDISQLWTSLSNIKEHPTVLILAASDAYAYPSAREEEWAHLMIQELAGYLPAVKPGRRWGDSESNIDYSKSFPQNNRSHTLFLNDMNSEQLLLEPSYPDLQSVFFAGDFCRNEVKMATVEAAVLSGLHAARAVQMKAEGKSDITVEPGVIPSSGEFSAVKLALLPLAYGATAWATANVVLRDLANGQTETPEGALAPVTTLALIPLRYVADWVASLETLAVALLSPGGEPDSSGSTVQQGLQAAARGMLAATDHLCKLASERPADKPRGLASLLADVLKAVSIAASEPPTARPARADQTLRSATAAGSGLPRGSGRHRRRFEYVRRHRAKL
jgi:predicted NAD/FAD-dependent oxidoreductase